MLLIGRGQSLLPRQFVKTNHVCDSENYRCKHRTICDGPTSQLTNKKLGLKCSCSHCVVRWEVLTPGDKSLCNRAVALQRLRSSYSILHETASRVQDTISQEQY